MKKTIKPPIACLVVLQYLEEFTKQRKVNIQPIKTKPHIKYPKRLPISVLIKALPSILDPKTISKLISGIVHAR